MIEKKQNLSEEDKMVEKLLEKIRKKDKEEIIFDEDEFVLLMKMFDLAREQAYPNLERIGCPDPQIIRDIAFHRKVEPDILNEVIDHMWKCAPCSYEARAYADEYRKTKGKPEE